jgi:hypothetical protein
MALCKCLWCEMPVRSNVAQCPECGLQNPVGAVASAKPRRATRLALALLGVPLMLSAAFAANVKPADLPVVASLIAPAKPVQVAFQDPIQESAWVSGQTAVRSLLQDPSYGGFGHSFLSVSDGRVVTVCGDIQTTSGSDSASGAERYISVFGQPAATVRETRDVAFGVLWNRLCQTPVRAS